MIYGILLLIFFAAELLYFRIADKYNIIDKPNERSSHTTITLRGGGIIFLLPPLVYSLLNGLEYKWFLFGFMAIGAISFLDDIKPLSGRIRLLVHLIAVSLMFYQLKIYDNSTLLVVAAYILVIGTINAYNFMDGINGITGLYSLVLLGSIYMVNKDNGYFDNDFIIYNALGVLVFLFFNFRPKAKAFAGDVGSVSMAFLALFLLLTIIKTGDLKYFLFLSVYGVDSVLTIIHRLLLGENIFKAHRKHLYQYLSNEMKLPHLVVATLYALLQLAINLAVIKMNVNIVKAGALLGGLGAVYIVAKMLIIGGNRRKRPA